MKKQLKKIIAMGILTSSLAIGFSGCGAKVSPPEVLQNVEIVNEPVSSNYCQFIGEVAGSQGNFFTGDFTSNKNLMIGARNDLRNQAYDMGGNIIYVQEFKNSSAYGSLGTSNTTAIGKVYKCQGNRR